MRGSNTKQKQTPQGAPQLPALKLLEDWRKQPTKDALVPMTSPEPGAVIIEPTKDALRKHLWEAPKEVREQALDTLVESPETILASWTLSTEDVDRPGDVIKQDGWDLANYRRNPVVLFAHDSWSLPVARSMATYLARGVLKGTARFTGKDEYEFGHTVGKLVKGGFLSAVSVGFRPLKWEVVEDESRVNEDSWFMPVDFLESELLEYSCVPIPANPNALQDGKALRAAGINQKDAASFVEWVERQLDGDTTLVVPRTSLEQLLPPWKQLSRRARRVTTKADEPVADPVAATSSGAAPQAPEQPEQSKAETLADLLRCPDCGHEGPAAEFAIDVEEEDAAKELSNEVLLRELQRRGLAPMASGKSGAPVPTGQGPKHDQSKGAVQREAGDDVAATVRSIVKEAVEAQLLRTTGRLPP